MQSKRVGILNGNRESILISEYSNPDQIQIIVSDPRGWGTIILTRLELKELITAFEHFCYQRGGS
jgi:hypothetical protein